MKQKQQASLTIPLAAIPDRKDIPLNPGVYVFQSEDRTPLYIGKAKILRNRLISYFRPSASLPARIRLMVDKARFLEITLTRTEKEALILEAELITRFSPRYNIRLRDDKAYPFLRLGIKSTYPRLSIVRKRRRDGALYFGPYTSSKALRETLKIIFSVFRLRSCSDRAMKGRKRPCLKYQVERCSGPCTGAVSKQDYMADVKRVRAFLEGRLLFLVRELEEAMRDAASRLEFEKAALYRDRLDALKKVTEGQAVVLDSHSDLDVIWIEARDSTAQAAVLSVREGAIRTRHLVAMEIDPGADPADIYADFVKIYYADTPPPGEVVFPLAISDQAEMEGLLTHYRGKSVSLKVSVRGKRRDLLEMARLNAEQGLREKIARNAWWKEQAAMLKRRLRLERLPGEVEGVDISNTSGSLPVGSLVRFSCGQPERSGYRHYFLEAPGPDDYAMIGEVMERRARRASGKGDMPDLFIIDGGRGQLNAACRALAGFGLLDSVDVVALAKDRDDRGERIFLMGSTTPLILEPSDPVLRFCQRVRDEAHRFGVSCHRKRRSRKMLDSELLRIPGVGRARQMLLLRHFGSIENIASAGLSDMEAVPGLPATVCRNIVDYFERNSRRG